MVVSRACAASLLLPCRRPRRAAFRRPDHAHPGRTPCRDAPGQGVQGEAGHVAGIPLLTAPAAATAASAARRLYWSLMCCCSTWRNRNGLQALLRGDESAEAPAPGTGGNYSWGSGLMPWEIAQNGAAFTRERLRQVRPHAAGWCCCAACRHGCSSRSPPARTRLPPFPPHARRRTRCSTCATCCEATPGCRGSRSSRWQRASATRVGLGEAPAPGHGWDSWTGVERFKVEQLAKSVCCAGQ